MGRKVKCFQMSSGTEQDTFGENDYDEKEFDIEVADEGATAFADKLDANSHEEEECEVCLGEPLADAEWIANYNQRTARAGWQEQRSSLLYSTVGLMANLPSLPLCFSWSRNLASYDFQGRYIDGVIFSWYEK